MAVTSTDIAADMAIVLAVGDGKSVSRRYPDVKIMATDADVFLVGQILVELQDLTLSAIQRRTTSELENAI